MLLKPWTIQKTKKNDFFEWYESDDAIYLKPDQRLVFQEVSASDSSLWTTLIAEVLKKSAT